jgi:RNA polymerase-associated protein RTF1
MADIDEELLLLAGEASSEEDEDAPMNISRDTSVSPNERKSEPKATTSRKSTGKKAGRRGNRDDSEEEGEAYVPLNLI